MDPDTLAGLEFALIRWAEAHAQDAARLRIEADGDYRTLGLYIDNPDCAQQQPDKPSQIRIAVLVDAYLDNSTRIQETEHAS
jgi:hypothetical protein